MRDLWPTWYPQCFIELQLNLEFKFVAKSQLWSSNLQQFWKWKKPSKLLKVDHVCHCFSNKITCTTLLVWFVSALCSSVLSKQQDFRFQFQALQCLVLPFSRVNFTSLASSNYRQASLVWRIDISFTLKEINNKFYEFPRVFNFIFLGKYLGGGFWKIWTY